MLHIKHRKHRVRLNLELEGAAALAFHRAYDMHTDPTGSARSGPRPDFAEWLLWRAAEAYATASVHDRCHYWKFNLEPRDVDERSACRFLETTPQTGPTVGKL